MAETILSQGVGYGIILGFGALFALGMWYLSILLARFQNEVQGSEMFMTAKRSVKTGLVASAVVSSWTIAATLLTSSTWCYEYGVSGAYFYGAGATVQIFVFAVAAMELKRRAPGAHTFLELARIRYGKAGHITFITYSTIYAIINCVNILVGGSAVFTALTGMNVVAGVWLLPVGVVIYTLTGGIKATILTDYSHTVVIYAMVLAGLFIVYTRSDILGSPDIVYDRLRAAAKTTPVPGNAGGEYLTMHSQDGVLLGVVFWCAVFGTTIDVQLFQKAITADPSATLPGYMIGGLSWFSIPFCLATTFGLAARAMQGLPEMHTITTKDITQGLAMPYAAQALMGTGGAVFVLLMIFMACTAGFSADIVSVAAVFTYDVYGAYINPTASGVKLLRMSHLAVVIWSVCMAIIATGITHTTIGVNYLVTCMGIFTSCAVWPFYSTTLWERQNKIAVIVAPIAGSLTAIACWLGSTHALYGTVSIATTSNIIPLIIGNGVSLISGALYSIICTFAFGADDFDWNRLKTEIHIADDSDVKGLTSEQVAQEKSHELLTPEQDLDLRRGKVKAMAIAAVLCLVFVILWPLPMYGTKNIFSRGFFKFWVALTFLWAFGAAFTITIMPLVQGRKTIKLFFTTMIFGKTPSETAALEGVGVEGGEDIDYRSSGPGDEKCTMADEQAV
ncbi:hypothetical protein LTR91_007252 [Friedmanniomyces endolithicus]|uniref:Urea active transporter n=1 Tax=Friedmanniomyces endolithicus TaxID=329885 RepID=A0AAN6KRS3_9PEZI|nr:hypothetical protein LTR94_002858 [Friedmanniomyces endolithicus]KAK0777840.1 hypothetical protein LTR38_015030 [Friedmanniomyces endolithicus]KAK0780496.1 hypothetical protein LTR75_015001 [Friedmanniomyces endolithicus]KAK0805640.1 hypothetical protein LTR59_003861 [Friedmanniomyces endolithicus]KAK0833253.1 hypothetical protein LTR03_014954 [Friedmanniomyces endolithicus]